MALRLSVVAGTPKWECPIYRWVQPLTWWQHTLTQWPSLLLHQSEKESQYKIDQYFLHRLKLIQVMEGLLTTQPLAMQILPERSWSAIAKNLARPPFLISVTNFPSSVMSLYLFKRLVRGTLTLSKVNLALSTPFKPILKPMSSTVTPGIGSRFLPRQLTKTPWIPSFLPLT